MSDRWDDEDELARDRLRRRGRAHEREPDPEREPTVGELIEGSVRKLVTGLVIAGGLIGLGMYASRGGDPSVDYQMTSTPDGTVYRLDSERGRIIACRDGGRHCWEVLDRGQNLDDGPPAAPAPAPTQATQPQAVTTPPAQAQLPAPQNTGAPAAR